MKIYKCYYKNCKYENRVSEQDCIKDGNKRYHPECLDEKNTLSEIRTFYLEKINSSEVIVLLNKAINEMIFKKNISPDFLLFTLKYIHSNNMKLNSIFGVYYYINNYKIKNEYKKSKNENKIDFKNINLEDDFEKFEIKNRISSTIRKINKLI